MKVGTLCAQILRLIFVFFFLFFFFFIIFFFFFFNLNFAFFGILPKESACGLGMLQMLKLQTRVKGDVNSLNSLDSFPKQRTSRLHVHVINTPL